MFNLVCDRATLLVAWERVAGNQGARTAGVDAVTRFHVEKPSGVDPVPGGPAVLIRDGYLQPSPVKQAVIPKKNGKVRYLGIPTLRDRVAQMALKLILEPVFEVDFYPSSYGYRPGRRAQDAIAEIHHFTRKPSTYEWVIEGDIKACFDNVDHHVLMGLVAERIKDRKVLRLVSGFLRAGVVERHGGSRRPSRARRKAGSSPRYWRTSTCRCWTGTSPGSGSEEMTPVWRRQYRRRTGRPNFRLVRYADDFVVLVHGTRSEAEALKTEIAQLLAERVKMTLSAEKTHITHIDDGFVFLGFRIQGEDREAAAAGSCSPSRPSKRWRR